MKLSNGEVEVGEAEPIMGKTRSRSPGEVGKFGFWNVLERMKFLFCCCYQIYDEYPGLWLSSNLLHVLGSVTVNFQILLESYASLIRKFEDAHFYYIVINE